MENTTDDMENTTSDYYVSPFIKAEILKIERRMFAFRIITTVIAYLAIRFWLNSLDSTASPWFVCVLNIIQLTLYFSIFFAGYLRAIVCGLNRNIGSVIFIVTGFAGRVNDWELIVIPLMVIIMLIVSARAKDISEEGRRLFLEE